MLKRQFKPLVSARELDLARLRQRLEKQARFQRSSAGVQIESVDRGQVKGEWQLPAAAAPAPVILYLHGGGYAFCSPLTHRPLTTGLAKTASCRVFSLDYRLAPEHPFPAAVEDALQGYRYLLEEGIDASSILVAGDSAGGGLSLALLLKLKALGEPLPTGAMLLSPWTDMATTGQSLQENESTCAMFTAAAIRRAAGIYVNGGDTREPLASPLYGDLRGLPPLLVYVSDSELLRDDAVRLAKSAVDHGVDVSLRVWPRQPHVWPVFYPLLPEAKRCVAEMAEFARQRMI
ncbi:alpha/beta hydrolase [Exilibacterium tricleocarpae]|uniref:Alpha/beta hydrolase n=2 Tax=Exilibacterium tricleocarpae TaxID=2591008 RepID=A0A545TVZ3_9GAMM|nr:alpha/beta hydrolase [Exilibacterium tricleocarpae]